MHPLGLYLAVTDMQRDELRGAARDPRTTFAKVDATPLVEEERISLRDRIVAVVRSRVAPAAHA
jgi:hypothetical protein